MIVITLEGTESLFCDVCSREIEGGDRAFLTECIISSAYKEVSQVACPECATGRGCEE